MKDSLRRHWPEYLMEAAGLGIFMVSAGLFGTLLEFPDSPARHALSNPLLRRALMGLAMGVTAVALIYSPWGKQSGAHYNPAVTLTFLRLGKINPIDACFYVVAQFLGGTAGVYLVFLALGSRFASPPVAFVVTLPGPYGTLAAFVGELVITFILMGAVLFCSNRAHLAHLTGLVAGVLLAIFITFEAPLSGMSLNPARSFASAAPAGVWTGLWIYFLAPPIGMFSAAIVYTRVCSTKAVACAKLHHQNSKRCIFCLWQHRHVVPPNAVVLPHSSA